MNIAAIYMERSTIGQFRDGRNTSYNRFVDGNNLCKYYTVITLDVIVFFCGRFFIYCNTIQCYVLHLKADSETRRIIIYFFCVNRVGNVI